MRIDRLKRLATRAAYVAGVVWLACCGEADALVVGTVTEADVVGYSTSDEPNPGGRPPIVGATVRMAVDSTDESCGGYRKRLTETTNTDENGGFETPVGIYGGCAGQKIYHTVCVEHPDYEPYAFRVRDTSDMWSGQKFVNITLVPRE